MVAGMQKLTAAVDSAGAGLGMVNSDYCLVVAVMGTAAVVDTPVVVVVAEVDCMTAAAVLVSWEVVEASSVLLVVHILQTAVLCMNLPVCQLFSVTFSQTRLFLSLYPKICFLTL